jgi:hypothetical protein
MPDSWCRELLQMYANGRASFELDEIDYSLKPGREYQIREEKEEEQEQEKEKEKQQQ